MPKYHFVCGGCNLDVERYISPAVTDVACPACQQTMTRQLPKSGSQTVREVVDPYTNVRHTSDHKAEVKDRKTEYFWEVEVPRLIQTYSIGTCLEEGWLVYNDKGELVVNKPPSKR